jgi:AcrR family transcriptional regulator
MIAASRHGFPVGEECGTPVSMKGREAQVAGLNEFARKQKEDSRRRLVEAAERVFNRAGYIAPSVDDIAQEAGVSRQTFYRHYDGKLAIAMEFFERHNDISLPLWLKIGDLDYADPAVVTGWITELFDFNEARRLSLRTFVEMGTQEPEFLDRIKELIPAIVDRLGDTIPALAATRGPDPAARRRWVDAWLFFYHLREQCSMNASGFMSTDRDHVIAAFADGFLDMLNPESLPRRRTPKP